MDSMAESFKAAALTKTDLTLLAFSVVASAAIGWACATATTAFATVLLGIATLVGIGCPGAVLVMRAVGQTERERTIQLLLGDPALPAYIDRQFPATGVSETTTSPDDDSLPTEQDEGPPATVDAGSPTRVRRPTPTSDESRWIGEAMALVPPTALPVRLDTAVAINCLLALLEQDELTPDARAAVWFHLGNLMQSLGLAGPAASYLATAAEILPSWPEADFNLGLALRAQGRHEESSQSLRRVLDLLRDLPADNVTNRYFLGRVHFYLARNETVLGNKDEARPHYDRAISLLEQNTQHPPSTSILRFAKGAREFLYPG